MLSVKIDEKHLIAILEPHGALSEADFTTAAAVIDPYIVQYSKLNGIIIHTQSFPGWDSFTAMFSHLNFVKDHHQKVTHVALVTDSIIGEFAEQIASHFIAAEIKVFSYDELEQAKQWIIEN